MSEEALCDFECFSGECFSAFFVPDSVNCIRYLDIIAIGVEIEFDFVCLDNASLALKC